MALLSDLAMLRARVAASGSRLEKRRLVAEYLRELPPEDLPRAVTYLSGRAFPASDPRVLNVRSLPAPAATASPATPLALADVARAFGDVAETGGAGARRLRESRLRELAERASEAERDLLQRVIYGEMRMGLSEGLVLEAIAEARGHRRGGRRRLRGSAAGRPRHGRPHRRRRPRPGRRRAGPVGRAAARVRSPPAHACGDRR